MKGTFLVLIQEFRDIFCDHAIGSVWAIRVTAICLQESIALFYRRHHTAVVDLAAITAEKAFYFHYTTIHSIGATTALSSKVQGISV